MARAKAKPRTEKSAVERRSRKAPDKKAKSAKPKAKAQEIELANMSDALEVASSPALVLPETLDSASAGDIRDQLLIRRGSPLIVDAGQVRRTGMQAVQVLIAAAQTWQADGQSYAVTNPTGEFLDTLTLVGLGRERLLVEGFPG